ncbi:MAG: ferrochelatase [Desulfuromonas sp.]|nr:MAG: ferrochelatase [Desulfuromonas sp.]
MASDQKPTGLVLLNMGGPDSLDAVEPFLYNLFSDRELIQLPAGALLQKPFARLISHFRAKKVRHNYRAIGGKSPLLEWTQRQAAGIAERLDPEIKPYVAMRYWHTLAAETLQQMKNDGVERAVVLSMYPHYTGATTGSSVNDFRRQAAMVHPDLEYSIIEQWYDWPGYLDALASRIRSGLEEIHELIRDQVQIVFSAHALPQKFIDRGDPYLDHVMTTVRGVMERVGHPHWHVGFQSRSGPVRWMEPDTIEVMTKLAAEGHDSLLLVPISFVSDHIETLHEIDIEYRELAYGCGIKHFVRAPSLNADDDFLTAMAGLVRAHMEQREKG